MKNKQMYFGLGWVINFIVLLIFILIPKDNSLFNVLYTIFMILLFLVPLFLTASLVGYNINKKEDIRYLTISNLGSILMILLAMIRFIGSIESIAIVEFITIMLTFVSLEVLIGYIFIENKPLNKKQIILLSVATYIVMFMFFMCAMIISYDFSINW